AVSLIAVIGFILGVMALIIALALMTGFQEDIQSKILGASAHVILYPTGSRGIRDYHNTIDVVRENSEVVSASGVIYGKVMIYTSGGAEGIVLKGIDPTREKTVTDLTSSLDSEALKALNDSNQDRDPIVLGVDLANTLHAQREEIVTLVSPEALLTPLGLMPKFKKLRVVGTFQSGMYEYDENWALVSMKTAQRLFSLGDSVTLIEARIKNIHDAAKVSDQLQRQLGSRFLVDNWINQNRSLFSAMKLEKIMLFITITLIVLVAAFNVVSTLIMTVLDKHKDIAVLMSMGATTKQIMRIFMIQGVLIGIAGTFIGALLGIVTSWVMDHYKIIQLPLDVYFIPYLPFHLRTEDITMITGTALLISFLSTLYPAIRASRINPTEALRYE
ncbi:ABC transporter permease, partial [bacterium]|nr:ABC transporter permease [bacterium]